MDDVKIKLAILWVALMLCYFLGDILRLFAGDFTPGEIEGKPVNHKVYLGMAVIMVIPIIMVVLTLILGDSATRWTNIIIAGFFILFNLLGIKGMKSYDIFLIIISFGFNFLTIYYAWKWV